MYLTNQNDPDLDNFMDEHVKTPKYTITKAMLSNKSFTTCCFKKLFNTGKLERANVKFDFSIKTNGYWACVLMEARHPAPPLGPPPVPPSIPPVPPLVPSAVPPSLPPIPFTRLIAIDPGIGNLVTCCDENNQIT